MQTYHWDQTFIWSVDLGEEFFYDPGESSFLIKYSCKVYTDLNVKVTNLVTKSPIYIIRGLLLMPSSI